MLTCCKMLKKKKRCSDTLAFCRLNCIQKAKPFKPTVPGSEAGALLKT